MTESQIRFLDLAVRCGVLKFGDFTLKSGRRSPYFFNLGEVSSGAQLKELASCYADALLGMDIEFDMLFGPAYKGIPLVTAVALELADRGRDVPFAFNRKEAKDHGEGGVTVGAPLQGRVVVLDDVLTAGTALREALALIRANGAQPVGALLAFDRQERGQGEASAVTELSDEQGLAVASVVNLAELSDWLEQQGDAEQHRRIDAYRAEFGATAA